MCGGGRSSQADVAMLCELVVCLCNRHWKWGYTSMLLCVVVWLLLLVEGKGFSLRETVTVL